MNKYCPFQITKIWSDLVRYFFTLFLLLPFCLQAEIKNTIEEIIKSELKQVIGQEEPGCAVAYGKNNEHYFVSEGLENISGNNYITENSRFVTASVSKQFTAHMAIILADEAALNLSSTLENFLPISPLAKKLNAIQLMNHSSGIPDHWALFEMQGRSLMEGYFQEDALEVAVNKDFLQFQAGTEFSYSNGGYIALTSVIETVTKNKLNDIIQQKIFKRLNINAQYLDNPKKNSSHLVHGHIKNAEGKFEYLKNSSYIYGPSNLMITAKEFALWASYLNNYLLNNDEKLNNLSQAGNGFDYVAGLYVDRDENGTKFFHHGGYYQHATQDSIFIPSKKEFIIALCNRADFRPANITRNILRELKTLNFVALKSYSTDMSSTIKTGLYANDKGTKSAFLYREDGNLFFYGAFVSSPKKLTRLSNNKWGAQLSTSSIFVRAKDDGIIIISNEQNAVELSFSQALKPKNRPQETLEYFNETIGNIKVSFGEQNNIEFNSGLGKFPLTCSENNLCFAEYGYLILNTENLDSPILSTHHIQNIKLNKVSAR